MKESQLAKLYFNPKHPASFSGPRIFYKTLKKEGKKVTFSQINFFLQKQDVYTFHRDSRKPYRRNKIIVNGIDHEWEADLIDMSINSKDNKGVQFILLVVDIFSRYLFLQPLKSKKASDVIEAFKLIFKKRKPYYLRTDKGSEFTSNLSKAFFKDNDIVHFVTHNVTKSCYAERLVKTIKRKIVRYFSKTQKHEYVSQLQNFAYSYNHTLHSSINMAPAEVNFKNESKLWKYQYLDHVKHIKKLQKKKSRYKFKVGDKVLVSYDKSHSAFRKDYDYSWSGEVHTVTHRYRRQGIPVYKVKGYDNEPIEGTFYQSQLQKIIHNENKLFLVEKVLKRKKNEVLVHWMNWPSRYDSWIPK